VALDRRTQIALAEDDHGLRDAVAEALREEGLDVIEAINGNGLVGILQRSRVAVVVTDLLMPGLRGDDVLRLVRAAGDRTPFVVITAAPAPVVENVKAYPVVSVLCKPFTIEALIGAVRDAIPPPS
jgi:DNA-binding NtrC family response regulator